MVVRWSPIESNPYDAYLAMLGLMPGANMPAMQGLKGQSLPAFSQQPDQFTQGEELSPEIREFLENALKQAGISNQDLSKLSAQDLLQLLIDYFANEMNERRNSPPRNAGNMNGGQQFQSGRPVSWPSGGGSSGGGSTGGTSSGGGGGGGPGGPLETRTNGAGLPPQATGNTSIPGGLSTNTANGARIVREQLGFDGVIGGIGERPGPSDHPSGHAIDVMTQSNVAKGREIAEYFRENAERLGVKYVIYQQQIASPDSNPPWSWRPMEDRGSPTANHMDHVHISFN